MCLVYDGTVYCEISHCCSQLEQTLEHLQHVMDHNTGMIDVIGRTCRP